MMDFLRSYHLEVESKPGLGVRAFGTEYHMRMAMTELYADKGRVHKISRVVAWLILLPYGS